MLTHMIKVSPLSPTPEEIEAALAIYVDAFEKEAITKYQFKFNKQGAKATYSKGLKEMFALMNIDGYEIITAKEADEVVGVVIVKRESQLSAWERLKWIGPRLPKILPLLSIIRIRQTVRLSKMVTIEENTEKWVTLTAIAVKNSRQGQGIGKQLLTYVKDFYRAYSDGIYLYTGDKENYLLYQHLGYKILAMNKLDGLTIYHMVYEFSD